MAAPDGLLTFSRSIIQRGTRGEEIDFIDGDENVGEKHPRNRTKERRFEATFFAFATRDVGIWINTFLTLNIRSK